MRFEHIALLELERPRMLLHLHPTAAKREHKPRITTALDDAPHHLPRDSVEIVVQIESNQRNKHANYTNADGLT